MTKLIRSLLKRIANRCELDFTVNKRYVHRILAEEYENLCNAMEFGLEEEYCNGKYFYENGEVSNERIMFDDKTIKMIVEFVFGVKYEETV